MGLFDTLQDPIGTVLDRLAPDAVVYPGAGIIEQRVFTIRELRGPKETISLVGDKSPMDKLPFGGEQRVVKDFYPGNAEPVMHIMGSAEGDIQITGRLKDKKFSSPGVAYNTAKQMDAFRIRGNLLELTWGDWRRFAVIKDTNFEMKTTKDIDYQITFSILGFNPPLNCKVLSTKKIPFEINKELANQVAEFKALSGITIERSLLDTINDLINTAASAVNIVIDFVDNIVSAAEDVERTLNRALGVIHNGIAQVHRFQTRARRLTFNDTFKFTVGATEYSRPFDAAWASLGVIRLQIQQGQRMNQTMFSLREALKKIADQIPQARHLVQQGDTLQKLAFKYYEDQTQWSKIKDFNDLEDTTLVPNQLIEIPK